MFTEPPLAPLRPEAIALRSQVHLADDRRTLRILVFAVATENADNVCKLGRLGHYWTDGINDANSDPRQLMSAAPYYW
ncbi:hypothetical protein [Streptomyces decoyicus]|uniref:hypothetical protein n=1 Tax=Streptomyces decoyicus TaxID=249567 RepID=UPI002E17F9FB|nr:hypothetical protein OG532_38685 [Streptomyces decoyicus]